MNATLTGTPAELKQIVGSLVTTIPALAPLKDVELQAGHVDVTLTAPALGEVVARIQIDVTTPG